MARELTVVAIISAYNEDDFIGPVLDHLAREGVSAYLLDDGSTDGTVAAAEAFRGRGLVGIERLEARPTFAWEQILRHKEELGRTLDADWFIHHDADELRESPWGGVPLAKAIRIIDRLGYNAIDFEVLNFRPTDDRFRAGSDPREAFPFFEWGDAIDRVQIKCWKKQEGAVDLVSSGGHEAVFHRRRVFPLRFILRHYPVRSQCHGARKVESERRARFEPSELARGWHRQYDEERDGRFLRDPATLTRYDPDAVRLHLVLHHRGVEEMAASPAFQARELEAMARERELVSRELDGRNREVDRLSRELDRQNHEVDRLAHNLDARNREVDRLSGDLEARLDQIARLKTDLEDERRQLGELAARMAEFLASYSWRVTAPARAALRLLTGK